MITKQEMFDRVVTHLRAQGRRSQIQIHGRSACAYRGADGTKCAIGVLIPDALYRSTIEGDPVALLPSRIRAAIGANTEENEHLAVALQYVHDSRIPDSWEYYFKCIARDMNLRYTMPVEPENWHTEPPPDFVEMPKFMIKIPAIEPATAQPLALAPSPT